MLTNEDRDALTEAHIYDVMNGGDRATFETVEAIIARHVIRALETAQRALAGEDTVEWARGATGSHLSYPLVIGILDDLIEDAANNSGP